MNAKIPFGHLENLPGAAFPPVTGQSRPKAVWNLLNDWWLLVLLSLAALSIRELVPAWIFMWLLSLALFLGCKWLMWQRARNGNPPINPLLLLGYFLAWDGMEAKAFLQGKYIGPQPKLYDWLKAIMRIALGVALIWLMARWFLNSQPLVAGWFGMVGIILCLHFGLFQLGTLAWQKKGVNAQSLMRQPLRATSLANFWGQRWNAGFHHLAQMLVFRPLLRRCGVGGATLVVFLLSGLVHDLVISLPAQGGYGLPTGYFLIQGLGILFERTIFAKRLGLGRGVIGWLFTMTCLAGPLGWLFHPIFVRNVILPMLHAIGAT